MALINTHICQGVKRRAYASKHVATPKAHNAVKHQQCSSNKVSDTRIALQSFVCCCFYLILFGSFFNFALIWLEGFKLQALH